MTNPASNEADKKATMGLMGKYGYEAKVAERAPDRVAEILREMATQLDAQRVKGSRFLIGDRLSALDIYWAAFAALIQPLPDQLCKMSPGFRRRYTCDNPTVMKAVTPQLLAHRDFIYHQYLELPIDL